MRTPAEPLAVVDLLAAAGGRGPVWGIETDELNATLLAWSPGEGSPEHVNAERDVLVVVVAGSATVTLAGEERSVGAGTAVMLEKGLERSITAGPEGVRYLSVHRRRSPLQIAGRRS